MTNIHKEALSWLDPLPIRLTGNRRERYVWIQIKNVILFQVQRTGQTQPAYNHHTIKMQHLERHDQKWRAYKGNTVFPSRQCLPHRRPWRFRKEWEWRCPQRPHTETPLCKLERLVLGFITLQRQWDIKAFSWIHVEDYQIYQSHICSQAAGSPAGPASQEQSHGWLHFWGLFTRLSLKSLFLETSLNNLLKHVLPPDQSPKLFFFTLNMSFLWRNCTAHISTKRTASKLF